MMDDDIAKIKNEMIDVLQENANLRARLSECNTNWKNQADDIAQLKTERAELRAELARLAPPWDDAPANATHRAIDIDGDWLWFIGEPHGSDENGWDFDSADVMPVTFHRWRETLEERPDE